MISMQTQYLGMTLQNPLVASASPLCEGIDNIRRMEDAGAGAVVLHSLFEEQINVESSDLDTYLSHGAESYAESLSYLPDMESYKLGPEEYLEHIRAAKEAVDIPIVASLNGVSRGGWLKYAQKIEQAGADALELNVYYIPTDPDVSGTEVEHLYIDLVRDLKARVNIPLAVKIGPYFSSPANIARHLDIQGADGLVLFNRFYQPDLDIENLEVVPNIILSSAHELRLRLRWVAILFDRIKADLAVTGGVHTAQDVLKCMMAGAKVAMMTSALLKYGIGHITTVREELLAWMDEHEYDSIAQMQGSMSMRAVADPAQYVRGNYVRVLNSYAGKSGAG